MIWSGELVPGTVEMVWMLVWEIKPVSMIELPSPLFELATGAALKALGSQDAQVVMVRSLCRFDAPLVRFPNPLTFGSGLGERTPKKAIFQLWRSVSQSKKILHQKAQQNWNQSSMTFKFCQFETILKVSSGHCGPLTPFPQFRHLFPQSGQIY